MKKLYKYLGNPLLLLLAAIVISSCEDEKKEYEWEWDKEEEKNTDKLRFIWVDAAANFPDFANSKENILRDLKLAKETGFTDVVVDVRPNNGDVLFTTDVADPVTSLGAWLPEGYSKVERTATWDYLQAFIDAGKEVGLNIHAGINTFVGANRTSLGPDGMLYRESEKRHWATQLFTENGIQNTLDQSNNGARFLNPVHEEVQNFLLNMLDDLAKYEGLSGIFLDRGRFDGIDSDFSAYTKAKFEAHLGFEVANFPDDIITKEMLQGGLPSELPMYFKEWLEFRAKVIHDFMGKARQRVKAVNSEVNFGVYVGGWYSSYYGVGVNWASPDYDTAKFYPKWATAKYKDYGYADEMDIILIGAYAPPTKVYGTSEWTIEGFCRLASDKIKGDALVIGGPDVGNGAWATAGDQVVNQAIVQSVEAAMGASDGYFLFDMIHLKLKNQWQYVKEGIDLVTKEN